MRLEGFWTNCCTVGEQGWRLTPLSAPVDNSLVDCEANGLAIRGYEDVVDGARGPRGRIEPRKWPFIPPHEPRLPGMKPSS
jgi:hypothetical protein